MFSGHQTTENQQVAYVSGTNTSTSNRGGIFDDSLQEKTVLELQLQEQQPRLNLDQQRFRNEVSHFLPIRASQSPNAQHPMARHISRAPAITQQAPFVSYGFDMDQQVETASHAQSTSGYQHAFGHSEDLASMGSEPLLHRLCGQKQKVVSVIKSALQDDPEAVRQRFHFNEKGKRTCFSPRIYSFPINIALNSGAEKDILELLVKEGPGVLSEKDGPDQSGSLGIALTLQRPRNVVMFLMLANPKCARTRDRYWNLPLHTAVRLRNASLSTVKTIHFAYPEALTKRNLHGETPLDIAVRSLVCPQEIVDYLQGIVNASFEENTID